MTYDPRFYGTTTISVGASSVELQPRVNGSGGSLNKTTPVRIDSTGQLQKIDVSDEGSSKGCLGVSKSSVAALASAGIVTQGRLEDVTVSGSFGDTMYVSKTGELTHLQINAGENGFVTGDYVIEVGVIVKNATNPALKDLIVNVRVLGQL